MIASVYLPVALLVVTLLGGSMWAYQSERRPAHADAGAGALTVWQLRAQCESQPEPIVWPTLDPDAAEVGGFDRSLPTMQRLFGALHRL